MSVHTYDAKNIIVTFFGTPISGFSDGTFISVSQADDQFTDITGGDGVTQRSKTNNYKGSISLTLLNTSASNDFLSSVWNEDRIGNSGVGPISIEDLGGTTIWNADCAWVLRMPDQGFSVAGEPREWVLRCSDLVGQAGGNA